MVVEPFLHSTAGSIYEAQATLQRDHDNAATDSSIKRQIVRMTKAIKYCLILVNHL